MNLNPITDTEQAHKFYVEQLGKTAKQALHKLRTLSTAAKDHWLIESARLITEHQDTILAANHEDCENAIAAGKDDAFIDRLTLKKDSLYSLATQLEAIALLPDPVGSVTQLVNRPSGIQVGQMRMPIGIIGMIYESRPNVTVEAAALAIKSGNAIILRGGSDAINTNKVLAELLIRALHHLDMPLGAIQLVELLDYEVVRLLLSTRNLLDVAIPRGGKNLVQLVEKHACVPVIKHLDGICHTYIDASAKIDMAVRIADNAKTHRYGTCNTMETLLVHHAVAPTVFETLLPLYHHKKVELRLCEKSAPFANSLEVPFVPATEEDWITEYLAPILSIKIVDDIHEAIEHIRVYGSAHTETIVTEDFTNAQYFLRAVDSSSVMVNASSRFADGFEYGLGAEIGISTNKLHVRGPVGLEGLTTQKYIVLGQGQVRG